MRILVPALLALLALTAPVCAAAQAPSDVEIPEDGKTSRHVFGTVTLNLVTSVDGKSLTATVTSPGAGTASIILADDPKLTNPIPAITVAELDAGNTTPEILLQRFVSDERIEVQFLDLVGGKWMAVPGGTWDGARWRPRDLDGDDQLEFVVEDERFHYAFSCSSCSAGPPRYFKLIHGTLADISSSPVFRERDEALLWDFKDACSKDSDLGPDNGACASYVALARRLGHGPEAWKFMLENYSINSIWPLEYCVLMTADSKCLISGKFNTFPEALRAFLQRQEDWQPVPPPVQP